MSNGMNQNLTFYSRFNKDLLEFLRRRPDVDLESLDHATEERPYPLDKARDNKQIHNRSGDRIFVMSATGYAYIRFNSISKPKYLIRAGGYFSYPFKKLFLTNEAQPGKQISIIIGYEAFIEFASPYSTVKMLNAAGIEINPATQDKQDLALSELAKLVPQATETPTTYKVIMAEVDTEYKQVLPNNLKQLMFFVRDLTNFRYAWVAGKVADPVEPYTEVPASGVICLDKLNMPSKTLYFACATAGKVMQIEVLT